MHRVLIPPEAVRTDQITIDDPRDVHHLARVLRVKPGEIIECFDGQGGTYRGRVTHADATRLTVTVDQRREEPIPRVRLTLAQSLIPPAQFEWVLQKATELGAARIIPLVTSRTTIRPSSHGAPAPAIATGGPGRRRMERWRRIVAEAATQSGRATLPVVDDPVRFEDALRAFGSKDVLLPTLVEPRVPLADHLKRLDRAADVVILIGPEGDFSPEEVSLAQRAGA